MKAIEAKVKDLENLINHLISEHLVVQKENTSLKEKILLLHQDLQSKSDEHQNLEAQIKRQKLARGLAGDPEEAKAAKAKLGTLMREIDRCIAMLNE
jgi:hypothetical protein